MDNKASVRRAHGTGTLYVQARANGREVWYGRWYLGGQQVNRRLGPKLRRGTGEGLNRTQAEAELRRLMVRERPPEDGSTVSFASAAELMLRELEALERKATTLDNYRTILRAHLLPRFGERMVNRVRKSDVEHFMAALAEAGKAEKTRSGIFKLLSQVFTFAERQGWCEQNPCRSVRRPKVRECSEIRFLSQPELEGLISAVDVSAEPFGSTDRAIFLTAAMTGMRQGELLALRWRTSTGRQSGFACAATTPAATGQRRSRAAANARCPFQAGSRASCAPTNCAPISRARTTSSSPTR